MAKQGKQSGKSDKDADKNERRIAENRKARRNFEIIDTLECGIALVGSEVKSLRNGKVSIEEAYGRIRNNEVWLVGCNIAEYSHANVMNHESRRPRKLLLHRREIRKFANKALERGLTLVPLKVYFKEGRAKVELALARGKHTYDKRAALKKREDDESARRAMRARGGAHRR
jgi:SsrA-binding protein